MLLFEMIMFVVEGMLTALVLFLLAYFLVKKLDKEGKEDFEKRNN